tara:strand:+ start:205 stop:672 length:468 start_codon:yes stop_codon:yes gene_type:complete
MELVNGKQKQLTPPEIVMRTLQNLGIFDETSILTVGSFMANPLTTTVQVNNTLFAYLKGKRKSNKKETGVVAYVYSSDVQENLHENILKFLSVVQKRGEKRIIMICKNEDFLGAFLKIIPILKKYDIKPAIAEKPSKKIFIATVTFGKKIIGSKK